MTTQNSSEWLDVIFIRLQIDDSYSFAGYSVADAKQAILEHEAKSAMAARRPVRKLLFQVQRKFGHKASWWRNHEDLL